MRKERFKLKFLSLSNRFKRLERQNTKGVIDRDKYEAAVNKINLDLIRTVQQYENYLNGELEGWFTEYNLKRLLLASSAVLVLLLGVKFLWPEAVENGKVAEREEPVQAVFVAKAGTLENAITPANREDVTFSKLLFRLLGEEVDYPFAVKKAEDCDTRACVERAFEQDTTAINGLLVNTFYSKGDTICWINIFIHELKLSISGLKTDNEILLRNPPDVKFSIKDDVPTIAGIIVNWSTYMLGRLRRLDQG